MVDELITGANNGREGNRGSAEASRRMKPEHVTVGTLVTALVLGSGGILSFRDTANELRGDMKALTIAVTDLKVTAAAAREASVRGEASVAKLEDRVRDVEKRLSGLEGRR